MNDITSVLDRAREGDPRAAAELLPLVYQELRHLAVSRMAREAGAQTLQPTALVHEAWLRLQGGGDHMWNGRAHFFGAAAEAMRRILIERARHKRAARHGGGQTPDNIDDLEIASPVPDDEILGVSDALDRFSTRDPQKAELVKLRYFVGLTLEEASEVLGVAVPTASRWWAYSRAWLCQEIERQRQGGSEAP
jgi:RNA polymerase sigma factor (TIGR02999 family)